MTTEAASHPNPRIRDFLEWSAGMSLTELVMRQRNHPVFSTLTPDELSQAREWSERQAGVALANVRELAAQVAEAIVMRAAKGGDSAR